MDSQTAIKIVSLLKKRYHVPTPKLDYTNPLELLVALILAAQCTDKKVNEMTPFLFSKYKTASDYAKENPKNIEVHIHPSGFYHVKARHIVEAGMTITNEFNGKVRGNMDSLLKIPGIGRKSANIILTECFGKVEGIAIDIHAKRIVKRVGLSDAKSAEKIEKDLCGLLPKKMWGKVNGLLVDHGRLSCKPKKPLCKSCPIKVFCQYYQHSRFSA